jgi:hypothetical protein
MKNLLATTVALTTLTVMQLSALTIYTDDSGQLYSNPADDRKKLGDFEEKSEASEAGKSKITILNQKSPDFLLGKETHINMKFVPQDAPDMWLKAGVRIQGTLESVTTGYAFETKEDTSLQDAYLRRVRFEVAAGFGQYASFVMDIRNDKSNYGIENTEGSFSVGDAYVKIKKPFHSSLVNFKLYRAKIDVSRTETVKSARVIAYDRPYVADAAAQFISFNRRGANVQAYGDWEKKIHYQVAMGSAANPDKVKDAIGNSGSSGSIDLSEQSFFYGGKLKLSPFDGWEEKRLTESYMGVGKHFTIGAAYWMIPTMKGTTTNASNISNTFDLDRSLLNIELSAHYKGFMIQGEYFEFDDVINDITADTLEVGTSSGWYVTSEYVFSDFYYVAPFVRYESWDRFEQEDGHEITSSIAGVNWYLRGNTTKVGLLFQKDEYANADKNGERDVNIVRLTSQWFF